MLPKPTPPGRIRLDELLVQRGLFPSRSRARDAIERGAVRLAGVKAGKPGAAVADDVSVEVDDPASRYVSRAALKLAYGLDHFGLKPLDKVALDIGASTGGFTQVLLERGARKVIAIDVGHRQMAPALSNDARVMSIEGLNARELTQAAIGDERPGFIVSDVSFISLKLALPPALALAEPGASGVFLVKPQFEIGRDGVGKGGLVRDPEDGPRVAENLQDWLGSQPGWGALGIAPSPIAGGDGNREFLLAGVKDR